jgi:hypothetical protein
MRLVDRKVLWPRLDKLGEPKVREMMAADLFESYEEEEVQVWLTRQVALRESLAGKVRKNAKTWDDARLRALLKESNFSGLTQQSLAEKYNVSRQYIGKLLEKAKDRISKPNASSWSQLTKPSKAAKKSKY